MLMDWVLLFILLAVLLALSLAKKKCSYFSEMHIKVYRGKMSSYLGFALK